MSEAQEIQQQYIQELRDVLPEIIKWWDDLTAKVAPENPRRTWPTGISGHPMILEVFRKYFLMFEDLNNNLISRNAETELGEVQWGIEDLGPDTPIERQVDWLINDIATVAPDLENVVSGICFVPIGHDRDEEPV